jgi:hypothetical protein
MVTWLVSTTAGVLLFALVFDGRRLAVELPAELSVLVMRRRRPVRAERGSGAAPAGSRPSAGGVVGGSPIAPVRFGPVGAGPLAAGGADAAPAGPIGSVGRSPRRFDRAPAGSVERRVVAYQSVRLSAGPDALRSAELTRLQRRDEVEVIGEDGGALQVRLPDGMEGWVPRVVLVGPPADTRGSVSSPPASASEGRSARRRWRPRRMTRPIQP